MVSRLSLVRLENFGTAAKWCAPRDGEKGEITKEQSHLYFNDETHVVISIFCPHCEDAICETSMKLLSLLVLKFLPQTEPWSYVRH
jgi:hypothetical protein